MNQCKNPRFSSNLRFQTGERPCWKIRTFKIEMNIQENVGTWIAVTFFDFFCKAKSYSEGQGVPIWPFNFADQTDQESLSNTLNIKIHTNIWYTTLGDLYRTEVTTDKRIELWPTYNIIVNSLLLQKLHDKLEVSVVTKPTNNCTIIYLHQSAGFRRVIFNWINGLKLNYF